ncbi:MAG: hypothetical protein ABSA57_20585 [Candidatus Acidiferrales bacterium]|jgi:hypothetical protein
MDDDQKKKPVSPEKLAANRKNAQGSTGPRTAAGKRRASQNSYKHGIFALRLFPTNELVARDGADYNRIFGSYRNHYSPVGDLEYLYLEKIAVHSLRLARLLEHEQKIFGERWVFELRSTDRISRYEANIRRQLEKDIERLESLQQKRQAETNEFETTDPESDDTISQTDEATAEGSEPPADLISGAAGEAIDSSVAPDAPATTTQDDKAGAKQGPAPTNVPAENVTIHPPASENYLKNPGAQTLTRAIEKAMGPIPAEERKDSLRSHEHYGTDSTDHPRFIETPEDAELVEAIKRGDYDDPEPLE